MEKGDKLEAQVITYVLLFFLLVSIVTHFTHSMGLELPLGEGWEIPVIFLSLLFIARLLGHVLDIEDTVKELVSEKKAIPVERYETYKDFYSALAKATKKAKKSIDVTHIRSQPPGDFKVGEDYYGMLEKWIKERPDCAFRRITVAHNEKMQEWVKQLNEQFSEHDNFYLRICEWTTSFPIINMAIVDGREVFLAITGTMPERTTGIRIVDEQIARYFLEYYENIWQNSLEVDLEKLEDLEG